MKIIAYDLGTGGVKASLYDEEINTIAKSFIEYETYYPAPGWHEQKPDSWWQGVIESTKLLLHESGVNPEEIGALALSGHSIVAMPLDENGELLLERVPIWSDTRAVKQTEEFFKTIPESDWYSLTGNGFPAPCYSIFKIMWLKENMPEVYKNTRHFIGSKDYINYKLCGKIFTDNSYASGSGVYDLKNSRYSKEYLDVAGVDIELLPEIVPSHTVLGRITKEAAESTGLSTRTVVACGGVDNGCMALGSAGNQVGHAYTSLGSSSWIALNCATPVIDVQTRPYTFAHIQENMYTSAYSIFSGGNSLRWVRDNLCPDLIGNKDAYNIIAEYAKKSPIGAKGVMFNPTLGGATSQDYSRYIQGGFMGIHLGIDRADVLRGVFEGIALSLSRSLDFLKKKAEIADPMRFCGGGSKSPFWRQIFADIFEMNIEKTNIDQDAASLGAAAIAARAVGLKENYDFVDELHSDRKLCEPISENAEIYRKIKPDFEFSSKLLAEYGEYKNKKENE